MLKNITLLLAAVFLLLFAPDLSGDNAPLQYGHLASTLNTLAEKDGYLWVIYKEKMIVIKTSNASVVAMNYISLNNCSAYAIAKGNSICILISGGKQDVFELRRYAVVGSVVQVQWSFDLSSVKAEDERVISETYMYLDQERVYVCCTGRYLLSVNIEGGDLRQDPMPFMYNRACKEGLYSWSTGVVRQVLAGQSARPWKDIVVPPDHELLTVHVSSRVVMLLLKELKREGSVFARFIRIDSGEMLREWREKLFPTLVGSCLLSFEESLSKITVEDLITSRSMTIEKQTRCNFLGSSDGRYLLTSMGETIYLWSLDEMKLKQELALLVETRLWEWHDEYISSKYILIGPNAKAIAEALTKVTAE